MGDQLLFPSGWQAGTGMVRLLVMTGAVNTGTYLQTVSVTSFAKRPCRSSGG
jgi:hypothetical protein